jgi:RND family efflux transporter MFP subunit
MSREYGSIGTLREELAPARMPAALRGSLFGIAVLLLFGGLFWLGFTPKRERAAKLEAETAARGVLLPQVALVKPVWQKRPRALTLPGSLRGEEQATIYARADGYLSKLAADLGDEVTEGQLLATLDNLEVAREIQQARANLASSEAVLLRARAAHTHAAASLKRHAALGGFISQEELDQKRTQVALDEADVAVAVAARDAQRANIERLQQVQAYARVLAPFAGTITARHISPGALVTRGRESPLFDISARDTLRVSVQVPQSRVAGIEQGQLAKLSVAEYPGVEFAGHVTRRAGSLDSATRTMHVEVQVPNRERKLLPGMYANVTIEIERAGAALIVPASALIIGEQGVRVAAVDAQGLVRLLPVQIERDRGVDVEISGGLSGEEALIANPAPTVADGSHVQVAGTS